MVKGINMKSVDQDLLALQQSDVRRRWFGVVIKEASLTGVT